MNANLRGSAYRVAAEDAMHLKGSISKKLCRSNLGCEKYIQFDQLATIESVGSYLRMASTIGSLSPYGSVLDLLLWSVMYNGHPMGLRR